VIKDEPPTSEEPTNLRRHLRSQRGRIFDGLARAVSERGYADTAVADVLAECRMSRRTFYRHFANKEDCFLAAYDFAVGHVGDHVAQAFMTSGPAWADRVRNAFETFMAYVVAEPHFARLCLVEVLAAGPRALERRDAAVQRFSAFVHEAAQAAPGPVLMPETTPEAIVGGIQSVVTSRLLNGRAHELPGLVDDLLFWGLTPFGGLGEPPPVNTHVS
jgi:AcrR family transcriptional regulator